MVTAYAVTIFLSCVFFVSCAFLPAHINAETILELPTIPSLYVAEKNFHLHLEYLRGMQKKGKVSLPLSQHIK